jgi:predicted nucleic acid-binding protein
VILLDAYALVAYVNGEPAAADVEPLLRRDDAGVTVINLAEAIDVSQRVLGASSTDVRKALEPLLGRVLRVLTHQVEHAWRAAELRARHYEPRVQELSMADCFLLAVAEPGDEVATADPAVAAVAGIERIGVVGLPDRRGRRP